MAESKDKGISIIDKLGADIMRDKGEAAAPLKRKGASLTPVPGELSPTIPNHPVLGSLPQDPDIILGRLRDARREVEAILASIIVLQEMWGQPDVALAKEAVVEKTLVDKAAERQEADRGYAEAQDKKAQARVDAASPIEEVVAASQARLDRKAALLAAMKGEEPTEEPSKDDALAVPRSVEDFQKRMARQQEEAKAAVFTPGTALPNQVEAPAGWTCPTHGQAVVKHSARRNREYRGCPVEGCGEFEKL